MLKRDFGSFHVSNVQELISLPDEDYHPPDIPIDVASLPNVDSTCFGKDCRKKHFFLEDDCTFLNHGAFGAVLKEALQAAQKWQCYIERQPLRFYDRELLPLLVHVTRRMAKFVGCDAEDLVLVPNVTTAVNCVLRSLPLAPGDVVSHFSVEYGAVKKIINEVCSSKGAEVKEIFLPLPLKSEKQIVDCLEAGLSERTKVVVIDHIPSNTPYITPVKQVVDICHKKNILVLVDGAHALGQLDLDLRSLGADFYTTNCHKWFCSPKGAALMYVAKQHKAVVRPLVISHGYGSGFNSEFIWSGLRDYSPFLALHTALDFWLAVGPSKIRENMNSLACSAAAMLIEGWRSDLLAPPEMTASMLCVRLPSEIYANHPEVNYNLAETIQNLLYHKHNIEVPIKSVQGHLYVRISAHIYNSLSEYEKLRDAVKQINREDLIVGKS